MKTSDLRIVVIDDNRDAAYTLALLLKRSGFDVASQIYEASRALDCVKSERPHVVIMDIAMPGIDGYRLAGQIRADIDPPPRLVAVTGLCTAKDKRDAITAGFDAHFAKPADWPILVDESVAAHERLIVGSGIRGSKLLVTGRYLASLPNAEVLALAQGA